MQYSVRKKLTNLLILALTILSTLPTSSREFSTREIRAVWLTTIGGLDWPGRPSCTAEGQRRQREDLCRQLDQLQAAGINTVLIQTRIRATMIYPSRIEPMDDAFSGQPGVAPDYDPLQFCVEECHRRGMECHAWVICFPSGKFAQQKKYGRQAINLRRPDLVQRAREEWILNPAAPGTADYLADLCEEIVRGYDVDGLQLDYLRYPEKEVGFRTSLPLSARQQAVTHCLRTIHQRIKAIKPWLKISCSPVGKYADLPRQSSRGWNARDAVAQDVGLWLREGLLDWVAPMMYFQGQNFYPFACDWQERSCGRPIVPGLGIYMLDPGIRNWPLTTITQEMHFLRSQGMGHAFFRTRFLLDNTKGLLQFTRDFNRRPTLTPPMTWADSIAPATPSLHAVREGYTLHLSWEAVEDNNPATPVRYNLYRIPSDPEAEIEVLALNLRQLSYDYQPGLPSHLSDRICLTAIDAYGNESPASMTPPRIVTHFPSIRP